jgi:predicted O-methyltransferase YrrM
MSNPVLIKETPYVSPYEGFDYTRYEFDIRAFWEYFGGKEPTNTFDDCHPIFEKIISQLKPQIIYEIGTYKGKSAIHMANLTRKYQISNAKVICIDTWLGSAEHGHADQDLKRVHGYPTMYYQFLANVMHTNNQNVIVPIPQDAISYYRVMKENKSYADLIFVDGGHFYESVSVDIKLYWELVKPGGIMLGDDYCPKAWPDVVQAVHEFFPEDQIHVEEGKWWVQKPLQQQLQPQQQSTFFKSW